MSTRGLESTPIGSAETQLIFQPEIMQLSEAPSPEALLSLSSVENIVAQRNAHERMYPIRRQRFDSFHGSLLLEVNQAKATNTILEGGQEIELRREGFRPMPDTHITVINYANASRILKALGGKRKKLSAVNREVEQVDWSWRPTGVIFPFETKRRDGVKIISLVECPGTEELFEKLEDRLPGLELERQPMHIALMRKKGEFKRRAIGGLAIGRPLRSLDGLVAKEAA